MPNLEDKLNKMKFRGLEEGERGAAWRAIAAQKANRASGLSFNFALKPMTALIIALAVLFSGTGVVAASDAAKPGDALFGVDLAVERIRLSLTGDERRNEIAREQAQERLQEIQELRGDGSVDDDGTAASSTSGLTEAEAEIFTNETVVKLEINDRKFGFLTQAKTREALVNEIVARYELEAATVEAKLVIQTEDRASRPDDRDFLKNEIRVGGEIDLDEDERHDIRIGLDQVLKVLGDDGASSSVELRAALQGILDSSTEGKIKFESDGQKVEFKFKDGSLEMKVKTEDGSDDDSDDDSNNASSSDDDSDDDSDERFRIHLQGGIDSSDDDSIDDLNDDSLNHILGDDDSDDDSDNSGRGSDDDSDDSSDDDSDDDGDDNRGSGSGKDDKDDDD